MCLTINIALHTRINRSDPDWFRDPFVADRPLIIKKRVELRDGKYYSPYQGSLIKFAKILTATFSRSSYTNNGIEQGFHGFKFDATSADWEGRYGISDRFIMHYAFTIETIYGVIPAGTKYYIGHNNEVVTESVIYFKTLEDLQKYYGVDTIGTPHKGGYGNG